MDQLTRARLLQLQAGLRQRIEGIRADLRALAVSVSRSRQAVAKEHQHDVLEHLQNEAEIELGRVNQALVRLQEGRYNQCVRCGEPISQARLTAVPQTDICHACARHEAALAKHHATDS